MKRSQTPITPPEYEYADVCAIQDLMAGEATPEQQKRALDWIIKKACGTYEQHYYPNDRDTVLSLGRCFVGQQIVKLTKLDRSILRSKT